MSARLLWFTLATVPLASVQGPSAPLVDHHQHLFSPAATARATGVEPIAATDLIALLDLAGIRRAAVFSLAYLMSAHGSERQLLQPSRQVELRQQPGVAVAVCVAGRGNLEFDDGIDTCGIGR
jgi:hypothetical protein